MCTHMCITHLRCAHTCALLTSDVHTHVHYSPQMCTHMCITHLRCAHTCALLTSDVHTHVHYSPQMCTHMCITHLRCAHTCVHMCILPTLRMHTHITHPQSFVAELFAAQKVVAECTVFTNSDRYFRESLVSTVRTESQCSVSGSPEELNSAVI